MFLYVSPCFSSFLGFISSLPQLAWDKGYVVVVVVVVVVDDVVERNDGSV
jgi:hypothetical protein